MQCEVVFRKKPATRIRHLLVWLIAAAVTPRFIFSPESFDLVVPVPTGWTRLIGVWALATAAFLIPRLIRELVRGVLAVKITDAGIFSNTGGRSGRRRRFISWGDIVAMRVDRWAWHDVVVLSAAEGRSMEIHLDWVSRGDAKEIKALIAARVS